MSAPVYNFAYLDEQTKRMIRRMRAEIAAAEDTQREAAE